MPGPIQSIERAVAVLRLLARGSGPMGVGDVATALDLAKPTAHGILRTLLGTGFVDQDPATGRYLLGPAVHELGSDHLDINELRSRAIHRADALAARTGESVRMAVSRPAGVTVVHHVFRPDNSEQVLAVGEVVPAHATALGKVLLAYEPATELGPAPAFTHRTITERTALTRAIAEVRRTGWAGEVEEYRPGEAGVAAPIRASGGLVVAAIGISGPVDRLCDSHLQPLDTVVGQVRAAAQAVHRDLTAAR
ncbi:IclR family transcriptional regulator [Nocardia caishijiensis]|uniref:IclR family transcriptional regulator n=1 Tax=Nocardia caishijiensis TaxID=184756 RepID=A0ABQ6YHL1_9NOCA|nr:IclR family transcriptional regulator [Nocardia caishijiensis]KAF0845259.1 IclR family transcriptional regulator [Nocardia caishijiensis]